MWSAPWIAVNRFRPVSLLLRATPFVAALAFTRNTGAGNYPPLKAGTRLPINTVSFEKAEVHQSNR